MELASDFRKPPGIRWAMGKAPRTRSFGKDEESEPG